MQIARSIRDHARSVSLYLKVGVVRNIDSAIHAARTAKSICILPSGKEAEFLKDTPLEILDPSPEIAETFDALGNVAVMSSIHTIQAAAQQIAISSY
jgi:hypothetical protein